MSDPNCIFCKIVRGEIPAKKVHEDDEVLAFHDVRPQAPVHLLIIPKHHVPTLYDAGAGEGFRTILNTGRVGHQEVYHVHMHVLGGPEPLGPMLYRRK